MIKYATLLLSDGLTRFAEKAGQKFNIGYIRIAVFDDYDGPASKEASKAIDHSLGEWCQGSVFINSVNTYHDGEQFWVAYQKESTSTQVSKKEAVEWVESAGPDDVCNDPLTLRILNAHHEILECLEGWTRLAKGKAGSLGVSLTQLHVLKAIADGGNEVIMLNGSWNPVDAPFHEVVTKKSLDDLKLKEMLTFSEEKFVLESALSAEIRSFFSTYRMPLIHKWHKYTR